MSGDFFTDVPRRIPYAGPDTKEPLSYAVYDPEEAPRGWRALRVGDLEKLLPDEYKALTLPEEWPGWVVDLEARFESELARRRTIVGAREAEFELELRLPVAPPAAWELLTAPGKRALWQGRVGRHVIQRCHGSIDIRIVEAGRVAG